MFNIKITRLTQTIQFQIKLTLYDEYQMKMKKKTLNSSYSSKMILVKTYQPDLIGLSWVGQYAFVHWWTFIYFCVFVKQFLRREIWRVLSWVKKRWKKRERKRKDTLLVLYIMYLPGTPVRFDWSIKGCTIRRRALINLHNDNNDIKNKIKTFLHVTNDLDFCCETAT